MCEHIRTASFIFRIMDFTRFSSGLGSVMVFIHNSGDMQKLYAIMEAKERQASGRR